MSREDEIAQVRDQVCILAEQVARLLDISRSSSEADTKSAEEKLAVLESLMWKLHKRQSRLKAANAAIPKAAAYEARL